MQTTPAYVGWGTHEFDDSVVVMVNLPKDPGVYEHEFYIDEKEGEPRLHHRMIDSDVEDTAFAHGFDDDEGEALLTLLIKHKSYWLGFTDVEEPDRPHVPMYDGPKSPDDGLFVQQHIHQEPLKNLVAIAKLLYVSDSPDDASTQPEPEEESDPDSESGTVA